MAQKGTLFGLICVFGLCAWTDPVHATESIVIASRENALTNRYAENVLKTAYQRIGVSVVFQHYPDARSVIEADNGRADAEAARLLPVLKKYTNLRHVPVPLFYSELSAFVHANDKVNITGWETLSGRRLATVRGFKYVQDKLAEYEPHTFKTSDEIIERIENRRIEIGVLNRFLGQLATQHQGAQNVVDITPPLERLPVYHMVHHRHKHIIAPLTEALSEMQESGELEYLWAEFTKRELGKAAVLRVGQ